MELKFLCDELKNPKKDIADLIDLQFAAFAVPRRYHQKDDAQKDLQPWLDNHSVSTIVAYVGDAIAAYALLRPLPEDVERVYRGLVHMHDSSRHRSLLKYELAYAYIQQELRNTPQMGNLLFAVILDEAIKQSVDRMYTCTWDKGEIYIKRAAIVAGFQTLAEIDDHYKDSKACILRRVF